MTGPRLRLYIAGNAPNSLAARRHLKAALVHLGLLGQVDLEELDVLVSADRALADGIRVTPTLLIVDPAPARHLIGNLSDEAVLHGALCDLAGVGGGGSP